jgi:hypothetical protein
VGTGDYKARYLEATRKLLNANKPPNAGVDIPLVQVRYKVTAPRTPFDEQLEPGEEPMKVHIRLSYFWEYQIPFANWIITRVWLASQTGEAWAMGADPVTPVRATAGKVTRATETSIDVAIARQGISQNYFTVPLVSTWSMRMMSDPLPGQLTGQCPP